MYNDIYLLLTLRQREKYMYKNILVGMESYSWLLLSNGAFDSAKKRLKDLKHGDKHYKRGVQIPIYKTQYILE